METQEFFKEHYLELSTTEDYLLNLLSQLLDGEKNSIGENFLIEHITSRIKTPESTIAKLNKLGFEPTEENALKNLNDIIGVRLVTHFVGDVYKIRDAIVQSNKFNVITEKNYIVQAKPSGYRGYHIIIELDLNQVKIRAEIQLRTIAMDCWASLEHQIRYKKDIKDIAIVSKELKKCSDDLISADITMEQIREIIEQQTQS